MAFIATRFRMLSLVGYLLTGIMISPVTPGFLADVGFACQPDEIGVVLLTFGVGLYFSVGDLMAVRCIAVPSTIVQIALAVASGIATASFWGWSINVSLVFGLCISIASTVVLLRKPEAKGLLKSVNDQIVVGRFIVEGLVMVLVLILYEVLTQVHVARAARLFIAISDTFNIRKMVEIAKTLNSSIFVILRTHSEEEAEILRKKSLGTVFLDECELAHGMITHTQLHLRLHTKDVQEFSSGITQAIREGGT
ncbi:cation:proton antiporter [Nitrosomonas communis]|uniref:cation:proton antiporter domain-containing protein n=1 Tax=Nitrosomonas communis TaxID=44574 RepID=UPI003D2BBECD